MNATETREDSVGYSPNEVTYHRHPIPSSLSEQVLTNVMYYGNAIGSHFAN